MNQKKILLAIIALVVAFLMTRKNRKIERRVQKATAKNKKEGEKTINRRIRKLEQNRKRVATHRTNNARIGAILK